MMIILYSIFIYLMFNLSSFSSQLLNQSYLVMSLTLFEAVKELYKFSSPILIYTSNKKKMIRIIEFGSRTDLTLISVVNS